MIYYILENHEPVPTTELKQWAAWMASNSRRVALTTDGAYEVSTVFLGLNHAFDDDGPPLLFETMVFRCYGARPWRDLYLERCATWAEAEAMHARACAKFIEPNPAPAPGSLESSAKL